MSDNYFMKKPCSQCPFLIKTKPYLRPSRALEIAEHAENKYNSFTCHKTLEYDEENDENFSGETSKECAGFLIMQAKLNGEDVLPEGFKGFEAHDEVYDNPDEMYWGYKYGQE